MSFDVQVVDPAYRFDRRNVDFAHAAVAELCGSDLSDRYRSSDSCIISICRLNRDWGAVGNALLARMTWNHPT
jgi:hypothetical protein